MKDRIVRWLLPLIKALRIEERVLEDLRDVQEPAQVKEGRTYRYLGKLVRAVRAKDGREPNVSVHMGKNVGKEHSEGEVVTEGCCLECDLYMKMPCAKCKAGCVYKIV